MPRIIIKIAKDGKTSIETEGFTGQRCLAAAAPYRQLLGGSDEVVELKDEYFENEAYHEHQVSNGDAGNE